MKTDLDRLMHQHDLDAILITGSGQHNPPMVYLTGGAPINPELIKMRGSGPTLFSHPIEREEAAKTGLEIRSLANYPIKEFLSRSNGNLTKALALRYKKMMEDLGLAKGRIAIYGLSDVGGAYALFTSLQELMPNINLVGDLQDTLLQNAMFTKDQEEINRIRQVGQISCQVFDETFNFLESHHTQKEILVKSDGNPLTIGEIKKKINLWLVERGIENPEGAIFSMGRDAGIPHNSGNETDLVRLGEPIVFDLFPCEKGGGYFHDMTRTWCLGYASDEFLSLYEDVEDVFSKVRNSLKAGTLCRIYQDTACDLFEAKGHPTLRTNPKTEQGYVHSLGHGVGLNIHERPWFGDTASDDDRLEPGVVFTIEPGLYYPEKNLGIRLEDTFWVDSIGNINSLVKHPFMPILTLMK